MLEYTGSCHCGAIRFRFSGPAIDAGDRCNCSICKRKGALMSDFLIAPDDMHIEAAAGALGTYTFGSGVAQHHFCTRCGIYPFHQSMRKPGYYRVNLGCVEGVDPFALPVVMIDGTSF